MNTKAIEVSKTAKSAFGKYVHSKLKCSVLFQAQDRRTRTPKCRTKRWGE